MRVRYQAGWQCCAGCCAGHDVLRREIGASPVAGLDPTRAMPGAGIDAPLH